MDRLSERQPLLTLKTSLKSSRHRKASLRILTTVDTNFHLMLKVISGLDVLEVQVARSLQATMDVQSACLTKVIQEEVLFLESNRKSFPEDFVDHNVSTFRFWEDCFVGLSAAVFSDQRCLKSKVHRALESFMLFVEFYRSVDSVLSTWPIPTGFSYPRTSADLDLFLDLIPTPPTMAYSLAYRPRLSRSELRSVIQGEYSKVREYLSTHLGRVRDAVEATKLNSKWTPCVKLREKMERRLRKLFQPVEFKLEEVQRKTEEVEMKDFGIDLQAERVYASQQVLVAEVLVRTLNERLQPKTAKYMADFHQETRDWLCSARSSIRTRCHRSRDSLDTSQGSFKSDVLKMMTRWEEALDQVLELNRGGILEILTNAHQMQAEVEAFLDSCNILI